MTIAVIITILASFLWSISNHIDKFLIDGMDDNVNSIKSLMLFSTFVAGLVLSPIWLIVTRFSVSINLISLVSILLASCSNILAIYFYFHALKNNDASIVIVMFQLIPVFSYILSFLIFKETLSLQQLVGSIIILLSTIIISFDFEKKNNKSKFKALLLMSISSILYAVYYIFFDIAIRKCAYFSCAFWYQIGLFLVGLFLMTIKSYRLSFLKAIQHNGKKYFSINITNEIINLIASLLVNFANLVLPLAIANVLNGFQQAFVFLLGVLGVKFLPKYFKENLSPKVIFQKLFCISLSVIGLIIIFL